MKILITGASGFIGKALAKSLSKKHDVICMSRNDPAINLPWVRGSFGSFEDLRQLNGHQIEAVVHLAAATGRGTERELIEVNVAGSRNLMRYLIDNGCEKFVMASSIAAVGMQDIAFRPVQVPIPDEHPCLDSHGYGFSKYMVEELTKYYHRQNPHIDVMNMRLAVISPDDNLPPKATVSPVKEWTIGSLAVLPLSQALRALTLAVQSPHKPGVRIMNTAAQKASSAVPVRDILSNWWGNAVDLSYYDNPANEYNSVFSVERIREELGFVS